MCSSLQKGYFWASYSHTYKITVQLSVWILFLWNCGIFEINYRLKTILPHSSYCWQGTFLKWLCEVHGWINEMILSVFPIHFFHSVSPFLLLFFLFPNKLNSQRTEDYCTAYGIAKGWDKGNLFCWISSEMFLIFFHQKMEESCSGKFLGDPNVLFWFSNHKVDLYTGHEIFTQVMKKQIMLLCLSIPTDACYWVTDFGRCWWNYLWIAGMKFSENTYFVIILLFKH